MGSGLFEDQEEGGGDNIKMDLWEIDLMDGTDSGIYPLVAVGISTIKSLGTVTTELL